jgi:hypothetical protein
LSGQRKSQEKSDTSSFTPQNFVNAFINGIVNLLYANQPQSPKGNNTTRKLKKNKFSSPASTSSTRSIKRKKNKKRIDNLNQAVPTVFPEVGSNVPLEKNLLDPQASLLEENVSSSSQAENHE